MQEATLIGTMRQLMAHYKVQAEVLLRRILLQILLTM